MKHKNLIVALMVVAIAMFVFFVPVVYPDCYPLTCRSYGHACMGLCLPSTGSISHWITGYGGALVPDPHSNSIRPAVYQVFLP